MARPKQWRTVVNERQPSREETGRVTKRILLADDDPGVRELLGRVLESEHYGVTFAKTGREAAAKFVSDPPDLVLLDLNMPEKDGWAAFRLMNATNTLVPVIIITARPNQYPQAVELGVDAFMEKPLDLPVLLEAIQRLLAETEAERTRRLTDPDFKTASLSHPPQRPETENTHESQEQGQDSRHR
jgi:DNA-binding response OmpR family regulator